MGRDTLTPMSIWPDELAHGTPVPAHLAGHTLIVTENTRTDRTEVIAVIPRDPATRHADNEPDHLRQVMTPYGAADHGGTNETGLPCLWTEPVNGVRTAAVAVPAGTGTLEVGETATTCIALFKPGSSVEPRGWFLLAEIHDATREKLHLGSHTRTRQYPHWVVDDRDRWLAWAGITPA